MKSEMIYYGSIDNIYYDNEYQKEGYIRPSFTSHLRKNASVYISKNAYYKDKGEINLPINTIIDISGLKFRYIGRYFRDNIWQYRFLYQDYIEIPKNKNLTIYQNEWIRDNNIKLQTGFNKAINIAMEDIKSEEKSE